MIKLKCGYNGICEKVATRRLKVGTPGFVSEFLTCPRHAAKEARLATLAGWTAVQVEPSAFAPRRER